MSGAETQYRRHRARALAYGRWHPWADNPAAVRAHVRRLRRDSSASYRAIAAAAGVSTMTVHTLINRNDGRITAQTSAAITGLSANRLAPARVPALATTRRGRALIAMGHTEVRISQALGRSAATIQYLVNGKAAMTAASLHAGMEQLYEAWWDKRPPEHTRYERTAAEAARRRAQRRGWCTSADLDDNHIADPSYVPPTEWRRAQGTGPAAENPLGRGGATVAGAEAHSCTRDGGRRDRGVTPEAGTAGTVARAKVS